jgi:hypothetical protein
MGISCKVVADIRTTYVPTVITTDKFCERNAHSSEQLDTTIRGGIMPITVTFDYDFNKKNSVTLAYQTASRPSARRNAEYYDQRCQRAGLCVSLSVSLIITDNVTNTVDFTYIKKFKTPIRNSNIWLNGAKTNCIENFDLGLNNVAFERSFNDGIDREATLQLITAWKKAKWEMG